MRPFKILLLFAAVWDGANAASAQTWTQTSAVNTNWNAIASSADGSILYSEAMGTNQASIYISTNSGATWAQTAQPTTNSLTWPAAVSADGTTVLASCHVVAGSPTNGYPLYLSTNSGNSWTLLTSPSTNQLSWGAMSADGKKLIIGLFQGVFVTHNWVHISSNSGVTWSSNEFDSAGSTPRIISTADGSRMSAMIATNLFTTTNAGISWITNNLPGSPYIWLRIASSVDGSKLFVSGTSGYQGSLYVCISTNAGSTWSSTNFVSYSGGIYGTITCSADGTKVAVVGVGSIYNSTNTGATWKLAATISTNWVGIVSSADGNKLAATVMNNIVGGPGLGGIWISQTTPSPQLNLTPTNGSFKLSWLIPSTNFVMQQSSDLASWSDMTNTPVLNLTNLQNELVLSPTNSSGFYQLKTP
jgi:photosystem II stability/assembly factor-like uncharacterized protein